LFVEPHTPPGEYTLLVGMYDTLTGQRVQPYDPAGNPLTNGAVGLIGFKVVAGS
jgi:hypothetical protein